MKNSDYPKTVLSSIYPVFFGFTLSILYSLNTLIEIKIKKEENIITIQEVDICNDITIWSTVLILIFYYIVDWLNSIHNVSVKPEKYTPSVLIILLISNFVLCNLIISTTFKESYHYITIGFYLLIASWGWNIIYRDQPNPVKNENSWETFRFFLALTMVIGGVLLNFGQDGLKKCMFLYIYLNICLFFITVIRIKSLHNNHNKLETLETPHGQPSI